MKTFWIAVCLLAVMLTCVILNALYINKVANDLEARIEDLPDIAQPDCLDATVALRDYWEKRKPWAEISARFSLTDRISEQTETMVACASCGDRFGFVTARALLLDAIGDLTRTEQIRAGV